jgi:hypothetical protein
MAGKGGKGDMPGEGGAAGDVCPSSPPPELTPCEPRTRCDYPGTTCNCMGRGDDAHFVCKAEGAAGAGGMPNGPMPPAAGNAGGPPLPPSM